MAMGGIFKPPMAFSVTPHKVSICILVQVYAQPAQISIPFPFSSVADHNRLGIILFAITKSCDDIFEPKLDELIGQLREVGDFLNDWLIDHLTRRLSSLATPDDLFNFFSELRGILGGTDSSVVDDDQIILDPSSNLGLFVRRCLLGFNLLSFEGVCHLTTNIGTYCKDSYSSCRYELSRLEDFANDAESSEGYEKMDLENRMFEKDSEEFEARKKAEERVSFHIHAPKALYGLFEETDISSGTNSKQIEKPREYKIHTPSSSRNVHPSGGCFLRTNWQIQGYLLQQAAAIEGHGSSFPLNAFESLLGQLQKLAPELHRVHFLRYLNSLHHDDYPIALDNVHRYFDYRFEKLMVVSRAMEVVHILGRRDEKKR